MENQENMTYILECLKQINQTTQILSRNQTSLINQYTSLDKKIDNFYEKLDKKIDENYTKLDKKIDDNYVKLDKKIDDNYAKLDKKITNNSKAITKLQNDVTDILKEIKDLRVDIDTTYLLTMDTRKNVHHS